MSAFAAAQFGVMCSGFITILCKMLNNRSKTDEIVSLSRNVLADSFTFKTHLLGFPPNNVDLYVVSGIDLSRFRDDFVE